MNYSKCMRHSNCKTCSDYLYCKDDYNESNMTYDKLSGTEVYYQSYIDKKGKFVVPCRFDNLSPFGEGGMAMVEQGGKWGFVDTLGTIPIACQFDSEMLFQEGLSAVKQGNKWGFVNTSGIFVIPAEYDYAESFFKGKALVEIDDEQFYINKKGEIVK